MSASASPTIPRVSPRVVAGGARHAYPRVHEQDLRHPFAAVYPLYVAKVDGTTLRDFFAQARLNPNVSLITGVVCGLRVGLRCRLCDQPPTRGFQ